MKTQWDGSVYNANVDRTCDECGGIIKAATNYIGEYGSEYGSKKHIVCPDKKEAAKL